MNLGVLWWKWLGNDQNGTGFIRGLWKRFRVRLQPPTCDFDSRIYMILKNGEVHHRMLINLIVFIEF